MKKRIQIEEWEYYCDTCGNKLDTGVPITIAFGYCSNLDGEEYHFCSEGHAIRFLVDELRKQNPRTDIEFGKEK